LTPDELVDAVNNLHDETAGLRRQLADAEQAREALAQTNDALKAVVSNLDEGVYTVDGAWRYTYFSESGARILGVRPEWFVGGHIWTLWPNAESTEVYGAFHRAVASQTPVRVEEYYSHPYNKWFECAAYPSAAGLTVYFQDITARKHAEEALKEADHRKDEFLAMLAHELRNPLAPIRNAVEILRQTAPREPTLDHARDTIERQVNHVVRLVDDLLDLSRVSRGLIQLQKSPLDLAAVVRQATEMNRALMEARGHALVVTLPPEPVRVDGDFTRLVQVVSNLLTNAAKYTDQGGQIWLTVEAPDASDDAVLRVRDTGRGIDPAALKGVFNLFYQVERNLDRADGGLGIGLSLVKRLVEMHGGRVEAHSAGRGQGSEFVVNLPRLIDEAAAPDAPPPSSPSAARPLRVLVVDDNHDAADTLALLLTLEGHEVLTAYDGPEAVEVALAQRPAVVFLDIGLPAIDGYEACRQMREGGLSDAFIVALTGYGQDEDRRRSQEAGFDAHRTKPVELAAIQELLASLPAKA
jgi:PAS domain S-box-containing protein